VAQRGIEGDFPLCELALFIRRRDNDEAIFVIEI
jgi:hypothetical protein